MPISLPSEITAHWIEISIAVLGIFLGWVVARISAVGKLRVLNERFRAEERKSTDLEARLAHAVSDARHNAQQAQSFATQLTEARKQPAAPDAQLAILFRRLEQRLATMEHAAQFHRENLDSRIGSIEQFLREEKPAANPSLSFPRPDLLTMDSQMNEAFSTAGLPDDFTFVPDPPASARSAAGDLRSALS